MNAQRREQLIVANDNIQQAYKYLTEAREILDDIGEQERAYLERMPEPLKRSKHGEAAREVARRIDTAAVALDVITELDELDLSDLTAK